MYSQTSVLMISLTHFSDSMRNTVLKTLLRLLQRVKDFKKGNQHSLLLSHRHSSSSSKAEDFLCFTYNSPNYENRDCPYLHHQSEGCSSHSHPYRPQSSQEQSLHHSQHEQSPHPSQY